MRSFLITVMACAGLTGCIGPFDDDPMLAMRVPAERLRSIKTLDVEQMQEERAATTEESQFETAADPPAQLELTIEQCRAIALEYNLDLRVELLDPTIAATLIEDQEARFESLFGIGAALSKTDTPVSTDLSGAQTESRDLGASVDIPLRTGGNLRFDVPMNRYETDNAFATLNPAYTSDFSISISHNLLRNAGRRTNMHAIRVAHYQQQQSEAQTKLETIRVLANVDRAYWVLDAFRRELEVRKREHDLAIAQLERVRREVRAGSQPEVEIIRSETGVAETLEAIIIADNRVRDAQRILKRILNKPDLPQTSPTIIVPATRPNPMVLDLDQQRLLNAALSQRMELLELELQLAADASTIDFARNQTLPLAILDYRYNVNGLGEDLGDAFSMLEDRNFEDHRVSLRVEVPLGNQAARSRLRRALLERIQRLATRKQREAQVTQEVLAAADQLEANWQRVLAAQTRSVMAARNAAAEQRQFELGLRTSTDVLEAQAGLADAQSAEVRAIVDYQIAQVDLAFATGTVLGSSRVHWEPADPEEAR